MIIDHTHPAYLTKQKNLREGKWNGAYYYSVEIVNKIIPNVHTTRNWITVNIPPHGLSHSIVFIHNNLYPANYNWLTQYKDLILVCGVPETMDKVRHIGKPIYVPLSIDVEEVLTYKCEKDREVCFAGRAPKRRMMQLPKSVDLLEDMPREELLKEMAHYKKVYAVGRTAIEAKCLGSEVLPYDPRYPDANRWEVVDSLEAAQILQEHLDNIDKA